MIRPPLWRSDAIAALLNISSLEHWLAYGVSIDSRTLQKGDIFIALRGDTHDGHQYVDAALHSGAACAIVCNGLTGDRILAVEDTFTAMKKLAAVARERFTGKLIGLTGSVGKTTTKEILLHIAQQQQAAFATTGNLNNHYGVPLTLARLPEAAEIAIIEMGMNHSGEITALTQQARPHIALITTIAPAHVGNFDSETDIAYAKAEIFAGLQENGCAILPFDSAYFPLLQQEVQRLAPSAKIITFGLKKGADIYCEITFQDSTESHAILHLPHASYPFKLYAAGKPVLYNAVAALTAAYAAEMSIEKALTALEQWEAVNGRGQLQKVPWKNKELYILDDSYNASPTSMQAALETLSLYRHAPRRIAILGDMRELGAASKTLHADLLKTIHQTKPDGIITIGHDIQILHEKLAPVPLLAHADTVEQILPLLPQYLAAEDVVLIKASHGVRLDKIIQTLTNI